MARGRPKKNKEVKEKIEEEIKEEVKEETKGELLKLLAWFKGKDADGDITKLKFESEGIDLEEAINNLQFPKGINCLVNLEIKRGDNAAKVALAPQDARYILEGKQWNLLGESFRKL